MAMRRIQVTFTPEQHGALKALASKRGVSMSEIVREAIDLDVMPRYWRLQERRRVEQVEAARAQDSAS